MRPSRNPFLYGFLLLTVAAAALLFVWQVLPWIEQAFWGVQASPRVVTPRGDLAADEKATIELFEKTKDSVVYITTRERVVDLWTRNIFTIPRGTGSGFIWDEKGHVVTNYHVIAGASEARVRLSDGRDYGAALVGASPAHDLAVLRIGVGPNRPPPVPVGTSHDLKVGQKVFAIGNPFGLDWTLTTGIVSALDRSLPAEDGQSLIEHLIQTDAAINPGNSGGPLLDSAGRLIGVNTAIYSPSGAFAGVGFAVPVDTVNRVVPQLIARGRYVRPALGIEVDEGLNRVITQRLGVEGVLVLKVNPGSAAEAAGLRGARMEPDGRFVPGDIITGINDQPVDSVARLLARLDDFQIGDTVKLNLLREGRKIDVNVTLQAGS
ncbi:S1C family serine protease [Pelomicrobium methylotrophicum]|uniref:PDZ domain-containing protein n=1 Tax=Pelomicrobium methylotrophicum TaxID=2602750 RepID=A0A5C7ET10_9PROT|nr:trypsin-like peptidase domain-containing protein [Pelomicrobium methylotrophicum]TXF10439.1 PDZ domain-containing protein [Pelomicrobium methylotrophicum]